MFYYFGAKHRTAHKYQPPTHDVIVEPFAGSAGYACHWLEKGAAKSALLIEKDERVVELWQRILSSTPLAINEWTTPTVGDKSTDLLVTFISSLSSLKGNGAAYVVTPWMAKYHPSMRRRIAAWVGLFGDRIEVVHGDYREAQDVEATWFIDPPYQHQGIHYPHGADSIDYQELAVWSRERRGQTIVCEASPADWLQFRPFYTHRSATDSYGTELVWESDPTPTLFD